MSKIMWFKFAHRPLLFAWCVFFLYASALALLLQLLILPLGFPSIHAGNGLLLGGDWVGFHKLGGVLAQRIKLEGWAAWELSPSGQSPAGIAAIFYTLFGSHPYVLIPLNAALHASAGVVLIQIIRLLTGDIRAAVGSALPFILFPSALAWYAQIGKDGFYFAGAFLCLYGWIVLAQLSTWRGPLTKALEGVVWFGLGLVLMGVVRIYAFQLMQGISVLFASALAIVFGVRSAKGRLPWKKSAVAVALLFTIPLLLKLAPVEVRGTTEVPSEKTAMVNLGWHGTDFAREQWHPTRGLPRFLENSFLRIAVLRHGYFVTPGYDAAGSMADRNVDLVRVRDFITYFPRAAQLALFAPFPSDWIGEGHSSGGSIMRRIAGVEMIGVYLALIFFPYAVWRWRSKVELWLSASFGSILLLMYGYATPNIGSLYRLRYGFLMLLVAVGVAGAIARWRDFYGFPQNNSSLKA